MFRSLWGILFVCYAFLPACSIKQDIQPVQNQSATTICIIEDPAVRKGFLETYQQVLQERGYTVRTLPQGSDIRTCALSTTYMGRWSWDLAIYLSYARIDVYDDGRLIGSAQYDSRYGGANMGKFVKGEKKVRELVEKLFPLRADGGVPPAAFKPATENEPF